MRLLSSKSAALYCNYNPKTFSELRRHGKGPTYHTVEGSKSVVYTIGDLKEWMFENPKRSYLSKIDMQFEEANNPWSKRR